MQWILCLPHAVKPTLVLRESPCRPATCYRLPLGRRRKTGLGAGARQGGIICDHMHSPLLPVHQFTSAGWAPPVQAMLGLEYLWVGGWVEVMGNMTHIPQLFLEQWLMPCAAMGGRGGAQRQVLTTVATLGAVSLLSCMFRAGRAGLGGLNSVCHRRALLETLGG